MNIDITEIIVALIGLLSVIVTTVAVPLLKERLTEQQEHNLAYWIRVAVMAAEGMFTATGSGQAKYDYVIDYLEARGFEVDDAKIKGLIESAVYELINQFENDGSHA